MLLRDAAQRRTQRMSGNVLHPAVLYEERQVPVAVGIPDPAVAVAGPLEPERPRRFERRAGAPLHFGPEGVEPVALDRVFQPRLLAIGPVAPIPLYGQDGLGDRQHPVRSEEHTSELQSLMRISYAVFCLKKKKNK